MPGNIMAGGKAGKLGMGGDFYLRFLFSLLIVILWLGYLPCYWYWFVRPLPDAEHGIIKFKGLFKTGALILAGLVVASLILWAVELTLPDGQGYGVLWPSNSVLVLTIGLNGLFLIKLGGALGARIVMLYDYLVVSGLVVVGILVGFGEVSMEKVANGLDGRYLAWKWFLSALAVISVCYLMQRSRQWLDRRSALEGFVGRNRLCLASVVFVIAWGLFWLSIPTF